MIAVGVDTHKYQHVAVALSELGQLLGEVVVPATMAGYCELVTWLAGVGGDVVVGIEGAGSYGAGLCQHLQAAGMCVVEVERPRRRDRRAGKWDRLDALLAAKRVLVNDGISTPRASGSRSALAALLVAYRSCVEERTRLLNQLQGLHVTAPVALRERIGRGNGDRLAARLVVMRTRADTSMQEHTLLAVLRDLARRARQLDADAGRYRQQITELVRLLDARLPRAQDQPGQNPPRSNAITETTPLPPPLQTTRDRALDTIEASERRIADRGPGPFHGGFHGYCHRRFDVGAVRLQGRRGGT